MADFEQKLAMKSKPRPFSELELAELQRLTFDYFLKETNPENGLVPDSTRQGAPCSIAPTGFSLAAYPVGVERGFMTRDDAISRTLTSLRFFWHSPQGPEPDATGYKGFYYHFHGPARGDPRRDGCRSAGPPPPRTRPAATAPSRREG